MKTLAIIQGSNITLHDDGHISFIADADIDCDGSGGNPDHDPYFQPDTSLHNNGKALNAYKESFIVVPAIILTAVKPIILGCRARVHYLETGLITEAVVGDIGPRTKIGELSVFCAKELGMPSNPNIGGTSNKFVIYELWPGVPAFGYKLQPYK